MERLDHPMTTNSQKLRFRFSPAYADRHVAVHRGIPCGEMRAVLEWSGSRGQKGRRRLDSRAPRNAGLLGPRAPVRPLYGDNLRDAVPVDVPVKLLVK